MPTCSYCQTEGRLAARGLCGTCYARYQRNGTAEYVKKPGNLGIRECAYCHTPDGPFIKTLCRACYQRQYKNGVLELRRTRRLCEVAGCDEPMVSHGMCDKHRKRYARHGTSERARPEGWGAKGQHPLYERWRSMIRVARGGVDERWHDFWLFVGDVQDPPTPDARLYKIREGDTFGPGNFVWREPVSDQKVGTDRDSRNAYAREWSKKRPHLRKALYLKRHYGVTLEWYDALFEAQGGVCAICHMPETNRHHQTNEVMLLAVDHNKETGKVRGLLCTGCNTGIGGLRHSIPNLRAAITYLEHHAEPLTTSSAPAPSDAA